MTGAEDHTIPTFWRLQALGWMGMFALTVLDALPYIDRNLSEFWGRVGGSTIACAMLFASSCILRPACRSLVKRSLPWLQLQLRAFGWAALLGIAAGSLVQFLALRSTRPDSADLISNYLRYTILLLFWCNLYFSIKQWQRSSEERERLARAQADAREARLNSLRYQLNPHFLFNALNAVSTLAVEGNTDAVSRMLAQIADLLRASLDNERPFEIPLAEEMSLTERYLAIEQEQLGERLQVELAIAPETLSGAVPSMILQPLVENAVRHGIAPIVEGGKIVIRSELHQQALRLFIHNTGALNMQPHKNGRGIGLANTVERLQTLYGSDHKFDVVWPETGGCFVLLEIPFRKTPLRREELACAF
jgi:two-component system, LytTR family, sensor kinase